MRRALCAECFPAVSCLRDPVLLVWAYSCRRLHIHLSFLALYGEISDWLKYMS
jgi:hypothetical protein